MSKTVVVGEVAKLLLMGWFELLKQQGLTEEEADELYQTEKSKMFGRDPNDLPDV